MKFDFESVRDRIKADLQNPVNKVEGGFCMENIGAVAQEIARLVSMEIFPIPDDVFIDTAEGIMLDRKALDFNEERLENETDESFRNRILEKIQNPLTSGNENHYIYWAKKITGVGDAKCVPCWNGAGTVKVIVLSSDKGIPSEKILSEVYNYIETQRPICVDVTVVPATLISVSLNVTIRLAQGFGIDVVRTSILENINEYVDKITFKDIPLSYYKIGDVIFNARGVADIISYTINGNMESLIPNKGEFYSIQEVVINEA